MANQKHDPSGNLPDCDITEMLQRTFGAEPPREEFIASLRDSLEQELNTLYPAPHSTAHETEAPAPRRRTGRSLLAAATAVLVVMGVAIWSSRPSYSWTAMVRAMESQPWIESSVAEGPGQNATFRGWFSQTHRIVIRQSAEELIWDDLTEGVRSHYHSGSEVLERRRFHDNAAPSVERTLVSLLLSRSGGDVDAELPSGPIRVVRETWREHGRQIELDVELRWGKSPTQSLQVRLLLDAESQLPQQGRVASGRGGQRSVIDFEYPPQGPSEVYELGVPRSVVVQDLPEPATLVRVAEANSALPEEQPTIVVERSVSSEPENSDASLTEQAGDFGPSGGESRPDAARAIPAVVPLRMSSVAMSQRIDDRMAEFWSRSGVTAVEECDDLEFLRRAYLDLTGRIPTVSEVRTFLRDESDGRREQLVEQLLGRRDHATHLAAVWRRFLLPEGVDLSQYGGTASFEQWLTDRFRSNSPYDELVRELLLAEGRLNESGPVLFYTALKMAPEALAAQTSKAFLGMRLECAQCHDHFFDNRWKQEDFWGFAAFFARISRPQGKMENISRVLQVKDTEWGDVTLPDQDEVVPPRYPLGETLVEQAATGSRRQELADWITAPENPHFARATVNRVWAHLFGRGLVEPVDDLRSDNPSLCPEVHDDLAGYFIATGFDLRELLRVIVRSKTYQRTSRAPDDDPSRALHFAQMNIKSFTAEQLYDSIAVATRLESPASQDGSLVRASNGSRQAFLAQFSAPAGHVTDFQSGIPQALTLMNGRLIESATGVQSSGLLRALEAPFFSDEQRVETLYLATLSRLPDDSERRTMFEYITEPEANRSERLGDILWALLNSAEFTLNH